MASTYKIYDTHIHYGLGKEIIEYNIVPIIHGEPDSLINALNSYDISKAVVLPPDRMLNPPVDTDFHLVNEAVADLVAQYPDRLIGAIRLNPLFGEKFVWDTIRYFVEERGLRGIKLVSRADFYNPSNLKIVGPVFEAAGHYNITIVYHSGHPSRDIPSLQAFGARHYPDTRVVLAHMGLHDFISDAIIACRELPNVFADMSQAWPYDIKSFVTKVSAEKLMYGSDAPCQSPLVERIKVEECGFNDTQLEQIFYKNAQRVWGFDRD